MLKLSMHSQTHCSECPNCDVTKPRPDTAYRPPREAQSGVESRVESGARINRRAGAQALASSCLVRGSFGRPRATKRPWFCAAVSSFVRGELSPSRP